LSMITCLELCVMQKNYKFYDILDQRKLIEPSFPRVIASLAPLKHLRCLKLMMPEKSITSPRKEDHVQLHSVRWFGLQMETRRHYQVERLHLDWILPNAEHIAFRFDGKDCEDCKYCYGLGRFTQSVLETCKNERIQSITRAWANSKAKLAISFYRRL